MYLIYTVTLLTLFILLGILLQEERRSCNNILYGLAKKYWVLKEKRKFIRFNEEPKIRYAILGSKSSSINSKAHNISKKGICISNYEKLNKKDMLDLEIGLGGALKPIRLIGQVVWQKEIKDSDKEGRRIFTTGIRFCKIDPASEAILISHLYKIAPLYRR
jgi:hypothetical protein